MSGALYLSTKAPESLLEIKILNAFLHSVKNLKDCAEPYFIALSIRDINSLFSFNVCG